MPYSYQQINVTSRFFFTVIRNRLVLAARYLADIQLGNPPFYELARYDDTYALGGGNGVRGVPGQRYYGKVKVFASAEARMRVGAFDLRGKHMTVGVAGFFDAGRAWAELASHPELDGTGIGSSTASAPGCACRRARPSSCAATSPGRPTPARSVATSPPGRRSERDGRSDSLLASWPAAGP